MSFERDNGQIDVLYGTCEIVDFDEEKAVKETENELDDGVGE